MVAPAMGQTLGPGTQTKKEGHTAQTKGVPWLVTIVYELSVKDLISELQAQGFSVTPFDGVAESQLITNVASGLVMDLRGHILGRLTNFRVKLKPDWLTVITSDGRRLKPKSVEYDQASGYSVLEIPELAIEPPRFASAVAFSQPADSLRLLYQLPVWVDAGLSWAESEAVARRPSPVASGKKPASHQRPATSDPSAEVLTIQRSDQGVGPSMAIRVVEDAVSFALGEHEALDTENLKKALLDMRRLNAPDGSVVVNQEGEVIGLMEFLGSTKAMVKPIDSLRSLAARLVTRSQARHGWIGVRLAELPLDEVNRRFGPEAPCKPRLVVREVFPDSPAAHVGVKPEDFFCRFNEQEVQTLRELTHGLAQIPVGTEIPIGILREGEVKQLKLRIEARPKYIAGQARRNDSIRDADRLQFQSDVGETAKRRVLPATGRVAQLGIKVERLTHSLREFFGVTGAGGVLVTEVRMDSRAGQAGLRAGDVIVTVNGKRVSSQAHLERLLNQASAPSKLSLSIIRHRQPLEIVLDVP
jgi:S1-C subfamily serine protease